MSTRECVVIPREERDAQPQAGLNAALGDAFQTHGLPYGDWLSETGASGEDAGGDEALEDTPRWWRRYEQREPMDEMWAPWTPEEKRLKKKPVRTPELKKTPVKTRRRISRKKTPGEVLAMGAPWGAGRVYWPWGPEGYTGQVGMVKTPKKTPKVRTPDFKKTPKVKTLKKTPEKTPKKVTPKKVRKSSLANCRTTPSSLPLPLSKPNYELARMLLGV